VVTDGTGTVQEASKGFIEAVGGNVVGKPLEKWLRSTTWSAEAKASPCPCALVHTDQTRQCQFSVSAMQDAGDGEELWLTSFHPASPAAMGPADVAASGASAALLQAVLPANHPIPQCRGGGAQYNGVVVEVQIRQPAAPLPANEWGDLLGRVAEAVEGAVGSLGLRRAQTSDAAHLTLVVHELTGAGSYKESGGQALCQLREALQPLMASSGASFVAAGGAGEVSATVLAQSQSSLACFAVSGETVAAVRGLCAAASPGDVILTDSLMKGSGIPNKTVEFGKLDGPEYGSSGGMAWVLLWASEERPANFHRVLGGTGTAKAAVAPGPVGAGDVDSLKEEAERDRQQAKAIADSIAASAATETQPGAVEIDQEMVEALNAQVIRLQAQNAKLGAQLAARDSKDTHAEALGLPGNVEDTELMDKYLAAMMDVRHLQLDLEFHQQKMEHYLQENVALADELERVSGQKVAMIQELGEMQQKLRHADIEMASSKARSAGFALADMTYQDPYLPRPYMPGPELPTFGGSGFGPPAYQDPVGLGLGGAYPPPAGFSSLSDAADRP